jgi:hypothetical protein
LSDLKREGYAASPVNLNQLCSVEESAAKQEYPFESENQQKREKFSEFEARSYFPRKDPEVQKQVEIKR